MNRRKFLTKTTMASAAVGIPNFVSASQKGPILTVAHITDVHIRPEDEIPKRAISWLKKVKEHQADFYLNGGDSIHDASYDEVARSRVLEQWDAWDLFRNEILDSKVYSCIGNHDPWWYVPTRKMNPCMENHMS